MNDSGNPAARIRAIVADVLALSPDQIDDSADFVSRYAADSLNLIEIVAQVEKTYQVILPHDELPQAYTVDALSDLLARHAV
ncbi:acyl carrier protein [Streptomyces sp. NBC_00564]|uniref:acyl carrier protein n=1 Tax=Streptomyces sp. NBC_00564 TaxID=2903663 RepID=UPI00352E2EE5|nr:acyl carrier protein [Streptomyces sp. NBC_00564]